MPSPLIRALSSEHGYAEVDEARLEAFLAAHDAVVLFFSGDPAQYPESNDVAVVLPQLMRRFAGRLTPARVVREAERALSTRFGFNYWPALVFLRDGAYLGAVTGMRDWSDYVSEVERLLAAAPARAPLGIPVVAG